MKRKKIIIKSNDRNHASLSYVFDDFSSFRAICFSFFSIFNWISIEIQKRGRTFILVPFDVWIHFHLIEHKTSMIAKRNYKKGRRWTREKFANKLVVCPISFDTVTAATAVIEWKIYGQTTGILAYGLVHRSLLFSSCAGRNVLTCQVINRPFLIVSIVTAATTCNKVNEEEKNTRRKIVKRDAAKRKKERRQQQNTDNSNNNQQQQTEICCRKRRYKLPNALFMDVCVFVCAWGDFGRVLPVKKEKSKRSDEKKRIVPHWLLFDRFFHCLSASLSWNPSKWFLFPLKSQQINLPFFFFSLGFDVCDVKAFLSLPSCFSVQ